MDGELGSAIDRAEGRDVPPHDGADDDNIGGGFREGVLLGRHFLSGLLQQGESGADIGFDEFVKL